MSDDEGILEFRVGEEEQNPWEKTASTNANGGGSLDDVVGALRIEPEQLAFESPEMPLPSKSRDLDFEQDEEEHKQLSALNLEYMEKMGIDKPIEPLRDVTPMERYETPPEHAVHKYDTHEHVNTQSVPSNNMHTVHTVEQEHGHEQDHEVKLEHGVEQEQEHKTDNNPFSDAYKHTETPFQDTRSSIYASPVMHDTSQFSNDSPKSVHFAENERRELPEYSPKKSHRRSSSHIEYHQDPEGNMQKLYIYDESGLPVEHVAEGEDSWEAMPTVGSYEVYDDKNNLLVELETEEDPLTSNAAASGYTRVSNNDDAASINSLDDKTDFLFDQHRPTDEVDSEFQMATTKSMLTDEQRIAYAGLFRLTLAEIANNVRKHGKKTNVEIESLQKWGTKIILKLYHHLGLDNDEQLMIESLASHNLMADDLTRCLNQHQWVCPDGQIVPAEKGGVDDEEVEVEELHDELNDEEFVLDLNSKGVEVDVKWTVMCDMFLILVGEGVYDSRSRSALLMIAEKLGLTANEVAQFERKVTDVLQIDDNTEQDWTEKDIIEQRRRKALRKKYAYVGLATVGGGLVIGLSGGLLAPLVGAGLAGALGTIGIGGTAGFLAGAGGTALIATTSTAIGATVGSRAMLKRAGHVKIFEFRPIYNNNRVNLVITISGWMIGKDDDVRLPFSTIDPLVGDVLSVHWEPELMRSLGQTINILATEALTFGVQQILAATIFTVLLSALQAPMWLAKLSYLVDNPWSISQDRAWAAGFILADTLMNRKLGQRPATLVGYGLGARVIYSCLTVLSKKNQFGLVQDVFMFGTPIFYNKKKFAEARASVSGRYVNGYSRKDWILAFLFPAAKRYGMVMGLDAIPAPECDDLQIENMDVSELVDGHMQYRQKMPTLLKQCGWAVLSEEFVEIEDPDPDMLREKQRKLLNELDHVEKPKKSGFFSSWNFDWMQRAKKNNQPAGNQDGEMLFDLEAVRQEMESLKPRMAFEQEMMPLPKRDANGIPAELAEFAEDEIIKPAPVMNYDDPESPRPVPRHTQHQHRETPPHDSKDFAQMQFDDIE